MGKTTRGSAAGDLSSTTAPSVVPPRELELFGPDPLHVRLRDMVRDLVEKLVEAEVDDALGVRRYAREGEGDVERRGYRHGARSRTLTTSAGAAEIAVPRARLFDEAGEPAREWSSKLLPRYARRARAVDDAVLLAYLSGANTRRIKVALKPLLGDAPLSRSAVSRVVGELKRAFDAWRTTRLDDKRIVYLLLDAIAVHVRVDRRVRSVPVLVALGVHESGEKELLSVMLMASESSGAWGAMVDDLAGRGLAEPLLCVVDGNAGLRRAVSTTWPRAKVQRCVVHKLRNLEAHCPKKSLDDLRRDFHAITEAESERAARAAHTFFVRTWRKRSEGVVNSLLEAGDELLTHFAFPRSQWKCLRTTNSIERLQEEFRRRVKTQASFPTERSVLHLFFAIYESGQIRLRRIDGWQDIPKALAKFRPERLQEVA
jgi:transposase-like protein